MKIKLFKKNTKNKNKKFTAAHYQNTDHHHHPKPLSHCPLVRKIARKLPECLLCERKHVPGLIPGLIPGWDLVTLPGSVPERALCEQKPDQCSKGCVVVMTHFIVRLFYRVFLKADQRSHDDKYVNWNEAAIRELLTICAEAEIILQFSEMVSGALYNVTWKVTCLYGIFTGCVWTHAQIPKITGSVNEPKSDHPGTNHGTHFPYRAVWKRLCINTPETPSQPL